MSALPAKTVPAMRPKRPDGPPGLALIEDAVHLLRRAPASVWIFHFLGAGAWTIGLLFAWAYVSWFRPSRDEIALGAVALVLLYAWLKTAQSEVCARLMALRLGAAPARFTPRRAWKLAAAQFAVHAWGPVLLLAAAVIVAPFGTAWMYFQNTTVLGADAGSAADGKSPPARGDAWALARLWPRQAVIALLVMSLLGLVVFANIAASFYLVPWLARTLLGMDNFMTVSGWSALNTTFVMSVCALTWFALDPLVKAFAVLRVFHGRSLRTGADLQIQMDAASMLRRVSSFAAVAVLFACMMPGASGAADTSAPQPPGLQQQSEIAPAQLDHAIDEVLQRRDFRWQLPPAAKPEAAADQPGAITRFINWLGRMARSLGESVDSFVRWLRDLISSENRDLPSEPVGKSQRGALNLSFLTIFLYGICVALVALLVWVLITALRHRARKDAVQAAALNTVDEAKPDLADESSHAAQLPSDGWLQLAREQAARADWRLALRALYLAHLARLDADGLISLKRHKTNLDYERELRRRALQRENLTAWFGVRRREFEAAWYGRVQPGEAQVREWFAEVEKGAAGLPS